jgi:ubiquitin C-terminal hydrolase
MGSSKGLCISYPNSCFYVSMLQCILHSPPLTMYFLMEYGKQKAWSDFVGSYAKLIMDYFRSNMDVCDATETRKHFNALCTYFDNGDQHDAHECIVYCIENLHKGLSSRSELQDQSQSPMQLRSASDRAAWQAFLEREGYSVISEIFVCHCKCIYSYNGVQLQEVYEYHTIQSTELNGSVRESILNTFEPELIEYTHQGNKVLATKQKVPVYLPLTLVVHLKRFATDGTKIDTKIEVEKVMTLFGVTYHLFAMVMHMGNAGAGHYMAVVGLGNEWTIVNDATAQKISEHDLKVFNPYICLYKKL